MGTIGTMVFFLLASLWMATFWMIRKWRFRTRFLIGNLILFLVYQTLFWTTEIIGTGHDRYGYSIIFASVFASLLHTALAFATGIGINLSFNIQSQQHANGQDPVE